MTLSTTKKEYVHVPRDKFLPPLHAPAIYQRVWNIVLEQIRERETFTDYHLEQLKLLCELFVDTQRLTKQLRREGYTVKVITDKDNEVLKPHPAIGIRDRQLHLIKEYSRMLKINIGEGGTKKEVADEWV